MVEAAGVPVTVVPVPVPFSRSDPAWRAIDNWHPSQPPPGQYGRRVRDVITR